MGTPGYSVNSPSDFKVDRFDIFVKAALLVLDRREIPEHMLKLQKGRLQTE